MPIKLSRRILIMLFYKNQNETGLNYRLGHHAITTYFEFASLVSGGAAAANFRNIFFFLRALEIQKGFIDGINVENCVYFSQSAQCKWKQSLTNSPQSPCQAEVTEISFTRKISCFVVLQRLCSFKRCFNH